VVAALVVAALVVATAVVAALVVATAVVAATVVADAVVAAGCDVAVLSPQAATEKRTNKVVISNEANEKTFFCLTIKNLLQDSCQNLG
jgi:hypothetical protein